MTAKKRTSAKLGPDSALADPFAWFTGQSKIKRMIADMLTHLSAALDLEADTSNEVIFWLRNSLLLSIEDEAHDLFPLLRLRAHKNDDFEGALSRLTDAHVLQQLLARSILPKLEALALIGYPAMMDRTLTKAMTDLGMSLRDHAAVLSAIIIPIARLRLKPSDLSLLGRSIDARRAN